MTIDQTPEGEAGTGGSKRGTTPAELIKRLWADEKVRFLVVGVINTIVSFGATSLVINYLAPPIEAATGLRHRMVAVVLQWAVWVPMVVWSTTTMKYFAFRSKGHLGKQIFRAYFIYLPAQGLTSLVFWIAMTVFKLSAVVGLAAAIFVSIVFSYVGHKYFTFRVPLEVGEVIPEDLLDGE